VVTEATQKKHWRQRLKLKKITPKDRLWSEESNGIIFLSKKETFSDEKTFVLSTTIESRVLLELGRKNSLSDHFRTTTEQTKSSTMHFCKHDYSSKINYFLEKKLAEM
jgi:hypothetical protein